MEGYKISLVEIPSQNSSPRPVSKKEEERMIEHEEIEEILKQTRAICKLNFHSPEEIFTTSTSNKFEEFKLPCRVQRFQNGRFISFERVL